MSKGYPDEPTDLFEGASYWRALGRNGYWAIDERTVGTTGARRTAAIVSHRNEAVEVSAALNNAYMRGMAVMVKRIKQEITIIGENHGMINMG